MNNPLKIYPSVEQCQINNKLNCPIEECGEKFTSESNLNLHILKTHKKMDLKSCGIDKQYFCPETCCPWNNSKHFKNMKGLRQHYLKVHTEKVFNCSICQKSFATNALLLRHAQFCNVTFNCLDCKATYECYDTLKTHSRRKKHTILEKAQYKEQQTSQKVKNEVILDKNRKILLPKGPTDVPVFVEVRKNFNIDQNSQTNLEKPLLKSKMTQVTIGSDFSVSHTTQHTQTGSKNVVLSVETQTNRDFINKSNIFEENFRDINTQTDIVESKENSCNTSFNLEDFEITFNSHIEKNTSSTQTYFPEQDIFSISTTTHDSTHTDTSDLLTDTLSAFDSSFFNCNMETQTDFFFENEIFNADYYSNMYTQTCSDIFNGLNDNQTQTVFDETLRSVESQTLMSSLDKLPSSIMRDSVHSETQTDAEFRQMLEIINS